MKVTPQEQQQKTKEKNRQNSTLNTYSLLSTYIRIPCDHYHHPEVQDLLGRAAELLFAGRVDEELASLAHEGGALSFDMMTGGRRVPCGKRLKKFGVSAGLVEPASGISCSVEGKTLHSSRF